MKMLKLAPVLVIVLGLAACAAKDSEEGPALTTAERAATNAYDETDLPVATPSAAEIIQAQLPSYPMTTCPISGEELGGMGDPYNHVANGRLVRFCCDGCIPEFEKDPAAAMAKVDAAYVLAGVDVP
ncbi:MAG: hypothetical protein DHS20C21_18640 [Gemmatimonadota bacterium]|nr:MAG: hypothetical protein DHS20C21_18640 [Gemmatimonadota bacterium]